MDKRWLTHMTLLRLFFLVFFRFLHVPMQVIVVFFCSFDIFEILISKLSNNLRSLETEIMSRIFICEYLDEYLFKNLLASLSVSILTMAIFLFVTICDILWLSFRVKVIMVE